MIVSARSPANRTQGAAPKLALLACAVFEKEIALHGAGATHILETRFFAVGLHDHPDQLRATLQENLENLDARTDIEAVALAYGLCGLGTAGLRALRHRLVIPRGHDCITVFMGSKEAYAEHQRRCPTCFYYSPGWNRERRVPGPERLDALRAEMEKKFDRDDVDYLVDQERAQWALRDTVTYLELGTDDAQSEGDYAKKCADWLGWRFESVRGDPSLLRDLLWGNWDAARFQVVEPGMSLGHATDETIFRSNAMR